MQVFLIRHPSPLIEPGICYGRLDVDCKAPQTCAGLLKPQLPDGIPVFSSPLRRARRLAEMLAPSVIFDDRLREIDLGDWEGRRWEDIDHRQLDSWAADITNFTPPGGESVAALCTRVLDFASALELRNVQNAAIVSHAGVMRVLQGHWQRLPAESWMKLEFGFGELLRLEVPPSAHGASPS